VGGTLNGEDSKHQIIESLVELETEGHITASPQERKEYAEFLVEEIANASKVMMGQDKQARFSSKVINTALGLWLQSNQGYKDFVQLSFYVLPSIALLKQYK
jgi:hypothetical protein